MEDQNQSNNAHLQSIKNLVDLCTFHGLEDIIISPGSRSAPLSILFSRSKKVNIHIVVDERSAAYFAMGIAIQKSKPVALVCTSGTASYNYAPAVAEAFFQRVPLLVLTADRPLKWLHHSEGQQIDQTRLYGNHVSDFINYDTEQLAGDFKGQVRFVERAFRSLKISNAPVHINIPIPEPLYNLDDLSRCEYDIKENKKQPFLINSSEIDAISTLICQNDRVLILLGQQVAQLDLSEALSESTRLDQVGILSNLLSNTNHENSSNISDPFLFNIGREASQEIIPQILITVGTNHVSKVLKDIFRTSHIKEHIHIDNTNSFPDTFNKLTKRIHANPEVFLTHVLQKAQPLKSNYKSFITHLVKHTENNKNNFLKTPVWSELHIAKYIADQLPPASVLHLGNSLSVRYFEYLGPRKDMLYFCNRGTSGIDGSLSTALGFAIKSDKVNSIVLGDTSFMYDSNALWKERLPNNLKIMVLNNGGGGIFKFIKGPSELKEADRIFSAKHHKTMYHLAMQHQVDYLRASTWDELKKGISSLYASDKICILEIFTDTENNTKTLREFFKHLKHTAWQQENGKP